MFDFFTQDLQLVIYLTVMVGAICLLLIGLLFGHDGDVEFEHDVDVHGDGEVGSGHHWFSFKVITAFFTAFGAGGAGATSMDLHWAWALVVAIVCGLAVGFVAEAIVSFFFKQQANSVVTLQNALGREATVVLAMSEDRMGEITFNLGGSTFRKSALSYHGRTLRPGDSVRIRSVGSPFIVEKVPLPEVEPPDSAA